MENNGALKFEIIQFKQWLYQNDKYIIVNSIIICLLYSSWMFNRVPLIDTMVFINMPNYTYNWLNIGREGAVLSKLIFQQMYYNPYLATVAGYIFIIIGGNLFGYIGNRCSKSGGFIWTLVPYMFVSPIFAEQFYFKLQILEMGWAYILCTISVGLNYFIIFKKRRYLYIISFIMMIWSFHTYQTFVITYAVMVGFAYILLVISAVICEERNDVTWKSLLLEHVIVFGVANVAGSIMTSVFFHSSGYLESTIFWRVESAEACIKNILQHIVLLFSGNKILAFLGVEYDLSIFYTAFYGFFSILVICLMLKEFLFRRNIIYFVTLFATVCIQFAPLLLTIYMGAIPSIRAQLVYPMVLIFNAILSFILVSRKRVKYYKYANIIIMVAMIVALWHQTSITLRLIYTDGVRSDEDIRLAESLNIRLMEMDAVDKPVAFVGGYENKLDVVCVRGHMIGQSVFDMFTEIEPHYAVSTWHTCSEMNAIGIYRNQASDEEVQIARKIAIDMPVWPHKDSVKDVGEFVVVKLGMEQWPEELNKS